MNSKKTLLSLALMATLSACGGGNGSSSSQGNGGGSINSIPKFKTVTNFVNACGESSAIVADVIFHDANGKVVSTAKTNSDGTIDVALPQGTQHISVITSGKHETDTTLTKLNTYLDVASGLELNEIAFVDYESSCPCKYPVQIDISALTNTTNGYVLEGVNYFPIELDNAYHTLEMCSQDPDAYLTLKNPNSGDVRASKFDVSSGTLFLSESDFTHQGVKVDYSHIDPRVYHLRMRGAANNQAVLDQRVDNDNTELYIFPSLVSTHRAAISTYEDTPIGEGVLSVYSVAYKNIDENGHFGQMQLLPSFDIGYEFSNSFLSAFNSQNTNAMSFNYTNAVPDADLVRYSIEYYDYTYGKVEWKINSEAKGTIPDFEFGNVLNNNAMDETSIRLGFGIYDYNVTGNYIDLLNKFSGASYEKNMADGLFDGGAYLQVDVNDF